MTIRILTDEVASQIAAGEVVERPASVVKELLENALDAGAARVSLRVDGAGKRLVEISDDGVGIPAEELPLAVSRHATSKLQSAQDLFSIASLGFRGEALASIGSVSRLTITSQAQGSEIGARLRVDGGQVGPVEPFGCPAGTVVRVEDLFYNVPARLKFLKTDRTERRRIDDLVTRYALAYPQVRLQLLQDGKTALQTSGQGDRREVLAALYGGEIARQLLVVDAQFGDFSVQGFISPISLTRTNRRELTFFINGRWVQDSALTAALLQAYRTMLMVGRYPMAALFLEIPPEEVDVNVHPAKAEVRFREKDRVFRGVQRAVRQALLAHTPVPEMDIDVGWPSWSSSGRSGSSWELQTLPDHQRYRQRSGSFPPGGGEPGDHPSAAQPRLPGGEVPVLRLIGQIGAAYLVAEGPDGLYLIDQHAAHERVLFEKMMGQKRATNPAQTLLEPVFVELSPAQTRLLEGEIMVLEKLGFQIEPFGPNAFMVRAVPDLLAGMDPVSALRVLVEDFEEDETPLQSEVEARITARICKRAAVKAGKILSQEEQKALLRDLEGCEAPRTCPHGRPTMIHLSVDLLERQFGRRGSR